MEFAVNCLLAHLWLYDMDRSLVRMSLMPNNLWCGLVRVQGQHPLECPYMIYLLCCVYRHASRHGVILLSLCGAFS